jgi:hypothetical protein
MEYEGKSPEISRFLNDLFPHEEGQCPTCGGPIGGFRDALSRREYTISHMCQACQDSVFGKDPHEVELYDPYETYRPGDEYGLDGTDAYDRYRDHQVDVEAEDVREMDYLYDGEFH